jgi:signal transduction histidine kinase
VALAEGVRAGGTTVDLTVTGTDRPLPPELEVVAYRTLQELLTNALRHGVSGGTLTVDLDWSDDQLAITVRNQAADSPDPGSGTGLAGLRERLHSVGGSFESTSDDGVWTASASMPVRREAVAE